MSEHLVVVGVFADRNYAEQALTELLQHGFKQDHIGFLVRDDAATSGGPTTTLPEEHDETEEAGKSAAAGAVTGSVVGSVVGAAAALLIPGLGPAIAGGILTTTVGGAALGAATGGFIGALVKLGLSENEARYYEQQVNSGRTIVIVQADDRPTEAFEILKRNRALATPGAPVPSQSTQFPRDPEATIKLEE